MSGQHQFDSGREQLEQLVEQFCQKWPFDCLRETIHIKDQNTRQNRRLPIRFVMLSMTIDTSSIIYIGRLELDWGVRVYECRIVGHKSREGRLIVCVKQCS